MTQLAPNTLPAYVRAVAPSYGIDPAAALAMSQHEGLSGNPGDNNTSFGPWQLHIGGALPSNIGQLGPVAAQKWAWSTDGVNYALQTMARSGAKNLTGYQAIVSLGRDFERSADIPGQIARAWESYGGWIGTNIPYALSSFFTTIVGGKREQHPGEGQPTTGEGNPIVPVPNTPGTGQIPGEPSIPALPTGGAQDIRLGKVGPFDIGIPSGLILGLLGLSLLLIGAILFVYGGMFRVNIGTVGGSVRPIYKYAKPK